jgi:hypothetical protein
MMSLESRDRFEQLLHDYPSSAGEWKGPLIDVADTFYACKVWFETHMGERPWTGADVAAMARMVFECKRENGRIALA